MEAVIPGVEKREADVTAATTVTTDLAVNGNDSCADSATGTCK